MFETMQQAEAFFADRKRLGIKPGLDRIHQLLSLLGNPQDEIQAIHIAGTNGKGSTLSYLNNALQENEYRIGVFTSPSIIGLRGHMFINDQAISEQKFISLLNDMYASIRQLDWQQMHPTEFEIITAMAFVFFAGQVDIALIEAGMGGREDTTNCFVPLLSIITNISRDHTAFLGATTTEIASHKAGVIKYKKPVITGEMSKDAFRVIQEEAVLNQSAVYQLGKHFNYRCLQCNKMFQSFSWHGPSSTLDISLQMRGEHQFQNASLALMALFILKESGWKITQEQMLAGLEKTTVPGRFELIRQKPAIIVDGAHNPAGIKAFLETVSAQDSRKEKHLIFAAFRDKELETMLHQFHNDCFTSITLTSFDHPRAASADALYGLAPSANTKKVACWKDALRQITKSGDVYYITGSLHFILQVRAFYKGK